MSIRAIIKLVSSQPGQLADSYLVVKLSTKRAKQVSRLDGVCDIVRPVGTKSKAERPRKVLRNKLQFAIRIEPVCQPAFSLTTIIDCLTDSPLGVLQFRRYLLFLSYGIRSGVLRFYFGTTVGALHVCMCVFVNTKTIIVFTSQF